ncbi:MAG: substrate-binding domain-containing protein [Treponema sp.]|nr:substrate-binding domain-containing protein [Treponema sp.]
MKKNMACFLLLCSCTVIFAQDIVENEPARVGQDIEYYLYAPFREDSRVVSLPARSRLNLRNNLPLLDGATALYPVYSAFVKAAFPENPPRGYTYTLSYGALQADAAAEKLIIRCSQTPRAYENLINGEVDIIFCAEPSNEQIAKAAEKGIKFNMTPIGIDAFVFFVNKNNRIDNITSEQVRAIYSGEITNWSSLNGNDEPIIAYQRPKNSGSQTILESVIMANDSVMEPLKENLVGGMGGMVEQVAVYKNYANAIGYSFLFFTREMVQNDQIKLLSVDTVYPSKETIQTGEYPFTGPFYAITGGDETRNMKRLIKWILSDQGQYLVEKTGYIPIKR